MSESGRLPVYIYVAKSMSCPDMLWSVVMCSVIVSVGVTKLSVVGLEKMCLDVYRLQKLESSHK